MTVNDDKTYIIHKVLKAMKATKHAKPMLLASALLVATAYMVIERTPPRAGSVPSAGAPPQAPVRNPSTDVSSSVSVDLQGFIIAWLEAENLNPYGDPLGTLYPGGSPLFDPIVGGRIDRFEYILARHEKLRLAYHRHHLANGAAMEAWLQENGYTTLWEEAVKADGQRDYSRILREAPDMTEEIGPSPAPFVRQFVDFWLAAHGLDRLGDRWPLDYPHGNPLLDPERGALINRYLFLLSRKPLLRRLVQMMRAIEEEE